MTNPTIEQTVDKQWGSASHSIIEIYAASANGKQALEVGEYKDAGSQSTTIFGTHWINGQFMGYSGSGSQADGFVPTEKDFTLGDKVKIGKIGEYGLKYAHDKWEVLYDNREVGYFPERLWADKDIRFKKLGFITVYGEIATLAANKGKIQMGNGIPATSFSLGPLPITNNGAASVSNYKLFDATAPPDFNFYYQPSNIGQGTYTYGNPGPTSFSLGGFGVATANAG